MTEGSLIHGTCVEIEGKGVLLVGSSGSGKSATALALIALGAKLISDDQVGLHVDNGSLIARPIRDYEGLIEARGIGILKVLHAPQAELALCVDMDQTELQRLPPSRKFEMLGVSIDLVLGRDNWHLAAGIVALLKGGRHS